MNQPAVFISCVSPEFRHTRSRVAAILTRLGYAPVIQEIFGTEPGDLRQVLRDKIDACEGLIQIAGQGYGAEPPTIDANYGRVSYTQFEFLYARTQKKKTWLLFAGDGCTRDTPLTRLDLPNDPAQCDSVSYQAERRALQRAYCEERKKDGHLYYTVTSDTDLELKIEQLRDELAELRKAIKLWQNKVLGAFAAVFVLLILLGGSVWWFGYMQHHEIQQIMGLSKEQVAEFVELVNRQKSLQAIPADWTDRQEKLAERVGISEQALVTIAKRLGVENVPTVQLGPALIDRIDRLRLAQQQAEALPANNPVKPLVETATQSGAYDRAENLLSVAREQIRAVGLIEEGQLDPAIAALDDAARHLGDISKDSPIDDHLALGYIYKTYAQVFSAKGDQARADDYLNKALAIFENIAHGVLPEGETAVQFADTIHGIGNIHQERREYRQAIDDYKIATTILPTYAYAWYDLFLCYADLAKRDEVDLAAMRLALAKAKETGEGLPGLEANHIAQLENILARFERENGRNHGPSPH